jgi:4-diphosphocytidyl-2-C-methyl-D-erythritol kinase
MPQIISKAYAKINLTLEVLNRLPSGYHNIESVIQKISLCDVIKIKTIKEGIEIACNDKSIPLNKKNTCWQMAEAVQKRFKIKIGVKITIDKKIPIGGGLGGGSSDAATVLLELNKLWRLKLTQRQMINIAKEVGKDIPFFLTPKSTSLIQRLGETIRDVNHLMKLQLVLVNPGIKVPTRWAYNNLTLTAKRYQKAAPKMIKALKKRDFNSIAENLYNDFEPSVIKRFPRIGRIKKDLEENTALANLMSGSGSSVYGVFQNKQEAKKAYNKLRNKYKKIYLVETI